MALTVGSRLGPYAVTAKIGEGGMGEVYRARDTTLDRDVAIKVLPDAFASGDCRVGYRGHHWSRRVDPQAVAPATRHTALDLRSPKRTRVA